MIYKVRSSASEGGAALSKRHLLHTVSLISTHCQMPCRANAVLAVRPYVQVANTSRRVSQKAPQQLTTSIEFVLVSACPPQLTNHKLYVRHPPCVDHGWPLCGGFEQKRYSEGSQRQCEENL